MPVWSRLRQEQRAGPHFAQFSPLCAGTSRTDQHTIGREEYSLHERVVSSLGADPALAARRTVRQQGGPFLQVTSRMGCERSW